MATEKRLIDANALSQKIGNMKSEITHNRGGYQYCNEDEKNEWDKLDSFDSLVCDAPTVDAVEVVHGRWIDDGGLDEDGNGQYRCSCCGVGEKHNPTVTVSYCWNCGAKMDGEKQ